MDSPQRRYKIVQEELKMLILRCIQDNDLLSIQQNLPEAEIDKPLENNWTPLLYACSYGHYDIVSYLLGCGSDPDQNCELFTPLMVVCSSSSAERDLCKCAKALIDKGVNVDAMDRYKTTALMMSCKSGHENLVLLLISSDCSINKADNEGMTALHFAVIFNFPNIVRLLIDNGTSKTLMDRRGRKPLDIALTKGLEDIINMLEEPHDVEQILPEIYVPQKTSFEEMLTELPSHTSYSGHDGFFKDVKGILAGMGLERFAEHSIAKNMGLSKFLNIKNKELQKMGVLFSSHREKIMNGNLRFIQHAWSPTSIPVVNQNSHVTLIDVAQSMANTAKHLHILWASTSYSSERIIIDGENQGFENVYQVTLRARNQVNVLMRELEKIHQRASFMEKIDKVSPVDLIAKKKHKHYSFFNVIVVSAGISLFIWKCNYFSFLKK